MNQTQHWLLRPKTITLLWRLGLGILALTVLADLTYEPHPSFGIDGLFAFNAVYGLAVCVAMIFGAKFLALFLKRPDDYYEADD